MRNATLRRAILPFRAGACLALITSIGCGSSGPTDIRLADLVVRSDKPTYSLERDAGAMATLVNRGSVRVYAPMNEYVYVEQLSQNGWINRQPWFTVDGIGVSFPVAPGDTLSAPQMSFGYVNRRAGTYRFIFEVAFDSLGQHLVPEEDRVSEPFEVTW